jgi:hypothetical protein
MPTRSPARTPIAPAIHLHVITVTSYNLSDVVLWQTTYSGGHASPFTCPAWNNPSNKCCLRLWAVRIQQYQSSQPAASHPGMCIPAHPIQTYSQATARDYPRCFFHVASKRTATKSTMTANDHHNTFQIVGRPIHSAVPGTPYSFPCPIGASIRLSNSFIHRTHLGLSASIQPASGSHRPIAR